uniref:Homeobox domain-containing protein n=1 Tax=Ursus americanus TaxID=9643 RepID=A0A452QMI5_URSAM
TALPVCPLPPGSRRRRLVLTPAQKGALQAWFQHNPYPGIASRERLAQELHIPESRIQVWFQNQRTRQLRQSRSRSGNSQGEGPPHRHQQPPAWTRGDSPAEPTGLFLGFSLSQKRVCVCLPSVWKEGLGQGPMLSGPSRLSLLRDGHRACNTFWAGGVILGQRGFESSCPETVGKDRVLFLGCLRLAMQAPACVAGPRLTSVDSGKERL